MYGYGKKAHMKMKKKKLLNKKASLWYSLTSYWVL